MAYCALLLSSTASIVASTITPLTAPTWRLSWRLVRHAVPPSFPPLYLESSDDPVVKLMHIPHALPRTKLPCLLAHGAAMIYRIFQQHRTFVHLRSSLAQCSTSPRDICLSRPTSAALVECGMSTLSLSRLKILIGTEYDTGHRNRGSMAVPGAC